MIKQLLNSVIVKYRDLSVSCRSIIDLLATDKYFAQPCPIIVNYPIILCGQSLPPPVYSVGNSVQVIFTSLSKQYSGFNAMYRAIRVTNDVNPINHAN